MKHIITSTYESAPSNHPKGYTMLMVLFVIILMMGSFVFFSEQLKVKSEAHGKTRIEKNQMAYLESFGDFAENYADDIGDEEGFRQIKNIRYRLSKNTPAIEGFLAGGEEVSYEFNGEILLEWNRCNDNHKADVEVEVNSGSFEIKKHNSDSGEECSSAENGYDDSITLNPSQTYTLRAIAAPFYYRITNADEESDGLVTDNLWHLDASLPGEDEPLTIKRIFP
jgi:hypothetical protein